MKSVVDNDILLKVSCYGLDREIFSFRSTDTLETMGVLASARFVLPHAIKKRRLTGNPVDAIGRLESLLKRTITIEPTSEELQLAGRLENLALHKGLSLDTGESLLCSVAIAREIPLLATGDKRAIRSIESLYNLDQELSLLYQKIRCLEQLVPRSLDKGFSNRLRLAICSGLPVDQTLSICFECNTGSAEEKVIRTALQSYINEMKSQAPNVLNA